MLACILLGSSFRSHNTNFVGNVQSILIAAEGNISLLLSSWCVKSVDFLNLDFVELLASLSDHFLVALLVNDENESVVILNGLDGGFTGKWVLNNSESVEGVVCSDSSEENFGASLLNLNLRSSEGNLVPDLVFLLGVSSLLNSSRGGFGSLEIYKSKND